MKQTHLIQLAVIALLLSTLNPQLSTARAQGSLTPPGAPAPTMKSLAQIEPRTPISSAPLTITQSGSYYLTTNLTVSTGNAITIATNGVTLDLNGFTISSTAVSATGNGIFLGAAGFRDVAIFNGHIRGGVTNDGSGNFGGSGFASGIEYTFPAPANVRVLGVSVSGCLLNGINVGNGDSTVVESCTVRTAGNYGIYATTIRASAAYDCGTYAIAGGQVSDSFGESLGSGYGLYASSAQNCYGYSGSYFGLSAGSAENCAGYSPTSTGLTATLALNCSGFAGSSGNGIFATSALHCSGGCNGNGNGLFANFAHDCDGYSQGNGYGLYAGIFANTCRGLGSSGPGIASGDGATLIACRSVFGTIGISVGNGCTIKDCSAVFSTSHGISAGTDCSITACNVSGSGANGISVGNHSLLASCLVSGNTNSGIVAGSACTLKDCIASINGGRGIFAGLGSTVSGCISKDNGGDGIQFTDRCAVSANHCDGNGGSGVHATGGSNRIEGNNVIANTQYGLKTDNIANLIVKNSARANGTNYNFIGSNDYGPIINLTGGGGAAVSGNSAPSTLATTDPWANFSF